MSDALVTQLARALNLPPDAARHTLDHLVATLREQLDATGETQVPGLGSFHRDEEGLYFVPDDGLARAVNHRYAGLRPIEAGPASSRTEPEAEPEEVYEPDDAFADVPLQGPGREEDADERSEESAEEETIGPDADLPDTAIGFQPLQSFIEPEEAEGEPETEPPEAFEEAASGASGPEPTAEALPASEPPTEEPPPDETPASEYDEEPASDEAPSFEEAPDDALAGAWAEAPETPKEEHVLGPLPSEEIEEAEYDLVDPDEPAAERPPDADFDEVWDEGPVHAEELDEEALSDEEVFNDEEAFGDEEVEAADTAEPPAPSPAEPPPIAEEPPVTTEPPAPDAEPVVPPDIAPDAVAPAVAATAAPPADREPAAPERRRGAPVFLIVFGVTLVLGVVALFWLLNREPERPDLAERPVPADTSVATAPPPTDTLATAVDTTVVAEAPSEPAEPEAPAAPADPLRGTAGIDPTAGGFTWVVASELDRAVAERRVARYREQGLRADVVAQEAGGRTRYRVGLGQFETVDEAEARRADLPPDVPSDSWILRL